VCTSKPRELYINPRSLVARTNKFCMLTYNLFSTISTSFLTQKNMYQSRRTEQKAPAQVTAEISIFNKKTSSCRSSGVQDLEVVPCRFEKMCTPAFA